MTEIALPELSWPFAIRPVACAAVGILLLVFATAAGAATRVDVLQDMESGRDGDLLTPAIMNASRHGAAVEWNLEGQMWVSTAQSYNLPGPVIVDGTIHPAGKGTRCWKFNDSSMRNLVRCGLGRAAASKTKITIAFYYTPGVKVKFRSSFTGPTRFTPQASMAHDRGG